MTKIDGETYLPCLWAGRINILKMSTVPRAIYIFSAIPIKLQTVFFTELEQIILEFVLKQIKPQIFKAVLRKKNGPVGINLLDSRLYYKAAIIKRVWYWHKGRNVDEWNKMERLETNSCTYDNLSLTKEAKAYNGEKTIILTSGARETVQPHAKGSN